MATRTQTMASDIEGSGVEPPTRVLPLGQEDENEEIAEPDQRNSEFRFTAEQIEKARQEERSKVQKERQRLKAELDAQKAELEQFRQFREQQEAERQAQAEAALKAQRDAEEQEMSAKEILARREQDWADQMAKQQREVEQRFAQLDLERQATRLAAYIQKRVFEEQQAESIAPQFVRYISGSSEEEVEASIELARQSTAEILEEIASQRPTQNRGVSVASGPSSMGSVTETNGDEVDYTNLSMSDYLTKVRPKLQIDGGQGLFG